MVSGVLGHSSIAVTKDVHGHLMIDDRKAAAASMSKALFGGATGCGSRRGFHDNEKGPARWSRRAFELMRTRRDSNP
ncbi:hypothetical protein GCM10010468_81510 [Actinocorallia longicatena]|uniref:Phage integrase family protein n=1 Tax=Actinocorallia longicatena TaxID=111803 RepID=A0ABP6QNF1_9ACTN